MTRIIDKHHLLLDMEKAEPLFDRLQQMYERIPTTTCNRQALCCALMPEVSYVEFLHMVRALERLHQDVRTKSIEKIIKYFFLNAVRIDRCPFLDEQSCLIYEDRPYSCRAYGSWSKVRYEELVAKNKRAKEPVRAAWERLGIKLPGDIVTYQPSYCDRVTVTSGRPITDAGLDLIQAEIFSLEGNLQQSIRRFTQVFFSDSSFFLTSTIIGYQSSLIEKVSIVREYLSKNRSPRLNKLIDGIRDSLKDPDQQTTS